MDGAFLMGHPEARRCSSFTHNLVCSVVAACGLGWRAADSAMLMIRTAHYVKFLSAMFRNSIAKSSISEAKSFTRFDS
jgi:hypothetical protein